MCRCDPDLVSWLENDFKTTLQNQASLEQWAQWLEGVVERAMKPYEGGPTHEFSRAARQFLLKWSFYRYTQRKKITRFSLIFPYYFPLAVVVWVIVFNMSSVYFLSFSLARLIARWSFAI